MEEKKKCTKCERELSINDFYKNRAAPDGLEYWCKDCKRDRMAKYHRKKTTGNNGRKHKTEKAGAVARPTAISKSVKEPLTTATPVEIVAALRAGVAREIIGLIQEKFGAA